jgi:hypothetical protein
MPAKKLPVDWNAFRALVASGVPIRQVARQFGVSPNTALSRAKRDNWHIAKFHKRPSKLLRKQSLMLSKAAAQNDKDAFNLADAKTRFHLANAVANASQTLDSLPPDLLISKHHALASIAKTASSVFHWDSNHPHPFLSFQGVLFSLPPDQLASKDTSFDQLLQQYGASHPVRDINPAEPSPQSCNQS